jgi:hypothetical protein
MRNFLSSLALASIGTGLDAPCTAQSETVSVAGTWRVALDPQDRGPAVLADAGLPAGQRGTVWLPGSLTAQGYGDEPAMDSPWTGDQRHPLWARQLYGPYETGGDFRWPYWLTPDRVYVGAAWYEREVQIPAAWADLDVSLFLERAHWVTEAWIGDTALGMQDSLVTPHTYSLDGVAPGTHTLRLRVDNRMHVDVGRNAHSVSDHTQGNYNGIIGRMELRAEPGARIAHVRIDGDVGARNAAVRVATRNTTGSPVAGTLRVAVSLAGAAVAERSLDVTVPAADAVVAALTLELGPDAPLWDEFDPHVYDLVVALDSPRGTSTQHATFGLRRIEADGTRLLINGRPVFLRGTLDCLIYPRTGYPPMDESSWERVFARIEEFGLNHVRFHSWCPPEAAFRVADRMGIYLQPEGPFWVNQGSALGLGHGIDDYVYAENDRILDHYGNHPSFVLMAYGNEPSGPDRDGRRGRGERFLAPWLEHVRGRDGRRLYTSGAGWPVLPENDFHNIPDPRMQQWGEGLRSIINGRPPQTSADHRAVVERFGDRPIVAHEIGQWCAYPDFGEIGKYHGPLRPRNFEIFQDILHAHGMGHLEGDFLMASGALQLLCCKAEIEMALRTPRLGGFQLLDLHDFPGQGTALVGVLDPFWDPKPYVTAEAFRAFCGPVVPLARLDRRVFRSGQTLQAAIEVSQFGAVDAPGSTVAWTLVDDGGLALAGGEFVADLPAGALTGVGEVRVPIATDTAMRATLHVRVDALGAANSWEVWCYPAEVASDAPAGVHVTRELDDAAETRLAGGGTVLLLAEPGRVEGGVAMGFSAPFWNYAWTDAQPPHTLGILVDPAHPLFHEFPTDFHSDWQWWELVHAGGAMVIDDLPRGLTPLVQPIDTWFRARRLAAVFEARVGDGRLLVCSLDITRDLEGRVAARQFRHSLMLYLASDAFDPAVPVDLDAVRALFRGPTLAERLGIRATASSAGGGYEPEKAVDGDPSTIWHTDFSGNVMQPHPHHLTLSLAEPVALSGVGYTARQDASNGQIGRYAVHVSGDGETWGEPLATGVFTGEIGEQVVRFDAPVRTRHLRLVALDSRNGAPHSAVAELRLIVAEGDR